MRITQTMINRNVLREFSRKTVRLEEIQRSIATGKDVSLPSDDPLRFAKAARLKEASRQNEQFMDNINSALGWIDESGNYLQQMEDMLLESKSYAQRGADGITTDDTRQVLAGEVDALFNEFVTLTNADLLGKNVFAGTDTKGGQPFTRGATGVTYSGNDQRMDRRVADRLTVEINVTGQEIEDTGAFVALNDLHAALLANDTAALSGLIDQLDTAANNMLNLSARNGSVRNTLALTRERLENANLSLATYISDAEDVDIADAIVQYETEQTAFNAAMQSGSKLLHLNILNLLR